MNDEPKVEWSYERKPKEGWPDSKVVWTAPHTGWYFFDLDKPLRESVIDEPLSIKPYPDLKPAITPLQEHETCEGE